MSVLYIRTPSNSISVRGGNLLINLNEVKSIWTLTPSISERFEVRFRTSADNVIEVHFPTSEEAIEWFEKISNLVITQI